MEVRKSFSRIFCSTLLAINFCVECIYFIFNFFAKKEIFCAQRFEIVLNGYFFVLKRLLKEDKKHSTNHVKELL
ncbi:hypothetical protein BpHYR1_040942, partial [Brachionus plicatilis]